MWSTEIPPEVYAALYVPWRRVEFEVDLLTEVFKRRGVKRVVEFGCGVGRHGYLLSKRGFDVLLTDIRDWRVGPARTLPFRTYDVLRGGPLGVFDAGYAMGLVIIFGYDDIVRALRNIRESIRDRGFFVFDYNFGVYTDPLETEAMVDGRLYRALLRKSVYRETDGGMVYEYRVEVYDERGALVGIEDTSYPIYSREKISRAVAEAGYEIEEMIELVWDPIEYRYRHTDREGDSVLYILRKI